MNGAVVTGWEMTSSFALSLAQDDFAEFRLLRPYFLRDFYPLTEYSTDDDAWAAFQWDRPEERDGIILAFRRVSAPGSSIVVRPHGLNPEGDYEFSFEDYGLAVVKSGRELADGLSIKIAEAPGSLLIRYRRVR
jgi:alpha-galactosidase